MDLEKIKNIRNRILINIAFIVLWNFVVMNVIHNFFFNLIWEMNPFIRARIWSKFEFFLYVLFLLPIFLFSKKLWFKKNQLNN